MIDDLFAEPAPSAASGAPAIPSVLTALRSWLVWRLVQKPGEKKPRKVPFYVDGGPRSGTQGTPDDRRRLATYPEAVAACQRGRYTGLGLAVLPGDGVVALDFDNCVVDGVIDRRIEALISETYAEISPSGTGVRAFMLGDLLSRKDNADKADRNADGSRKDGQFDIEFFGNSGFVTITANPTPDCTLFGLMDTVVPLTPEVLALYRARFNTDGALVGRAAGSGGGVAVAWEGRRGRWGRSGRRGRRGRLVRPGQCAAGLVYRRGPHGVVRLRPQCLAGAVAPRPHGRASRAWWVAGGP